MIHGQHFPVPSCQKDTPNYVEHFNVLFPAQIAQRLIVHAAATPAGTCHEKPKVDFTSPDITSRAYDAMYKRSIFRLQVIRLKDLALRPPQRNHRYDCRPVCSN